MSLLACRRVVLRLAVGASAVLLAGPALANDAAGLIQNVSAEVIDIVKTKPAGPQRQAAIQRVLETSFDLPYMGKTALAKYWDGASEDQRARFLKATATAEARAYSERFGQYGGQTLTIGKVTPRAGGASSVASQLNQTNGQPIKIEWEVKDTGRGLRITDVKIEGVSMVMTRRSDFNSYIQNNGGTVDALIKLLETRAAQ